MTPLERISERVRRLGDPDDPGTPRPLLSIEEFFGGNEHVGSIGCNLPAEPAPAQFLALFEVFARRHDVKDVRVRITAFDDPSWPFSDTVYVMTTAEPDVVLSWFPEELAPDEVWEGFLEGEACEPYAVPEGCRAVACWWD
jgi:hypothetical protein